MFFSGLWGHGNYIFAITCHDKFTCHEKNLKFLFFSIFELSFDTIWTWCTCLCIHHDVYVCKDVLRHASIENWTWKLIETH
jgi:hypothetical protein